MLDFCTLKFERYGEQVMDIVRGLLYSVASFQVTAECIKRRITNAPNLLKNEQSLRLNLFTHFLLYMFVHTLRNHVFNEIVKS